MKTIINKAAEIFGNQAIVVNIEAKKWDNYWECYTDGGKIQTGKDVIDWAKEIEQRGAGEILLNSIDNDGVMNGFDLNLGLKTSYKDFVNSNHFKDLVKKENLI